MNTPFFRFGLGILLVSIIIFMLNQINFIFEPLIILVKTLAMPFLIAGVLYYLFVPGFTFLINKGVKKTPAILSLYAATVAVLYVTYKFLGPVVSKQFQHFVQNIPAIAQEVQKFFSDILHSKVFTDLSLQTNIDTTKLASLLVDKIDGLMVYLGNNFFGFLSTLTGSLILLVVVPFILFYLFKDGDKLANFVIKVFSKSHEFEVKKALSDMNFALSSYIQGQLLVSFIVGIMMYIGYLLIGLDYPLLMAIIAMVTNLIPFLGPFIGLIFALIVGLMQSFKIGILVIVIVLVVQQIDSNFITPHVMGKKLDIHPLTIVVILLFASKFAGVVGLLIAVPTYAVLKIFLTTSIKIWRVRKEDKKRKSNPFEDD